MGPSVLPRRPRHPLALLAVAALTLPVAACTSPDGGADGVWTRALQTSEADPDHLRFVDLAQIRTVLDGGEEGTTDRFLLSYGLPFGALPPEGAMEQTDWMLATGDTTRLAGAAGTRDDWTVTEAGTELSTDGDDLLMRGEDATGDLSGLAEDSPARLLAGCLSDPDVVTLYVFDEPVDALDAQVSGFALGSTLRSRSDADHRLCLLLPPGSGPGDAGTVAAQAEKAGSTRDGDPLFTVSGAQAEGQLVTVTLESEGDDEVTTAAEWHLSAAEARAPWF